MKEKKDIDDRGAELLGEGEAEPIMLPELYRGTVTKKKRGALIIVTAAIVALAVLATMAVLMPQVRDETLVHTDKSTQTQSEWRGAFASKEYYENAMECAVGLRTGVGTGAGYCSGVVLSADGWIATSADAIGDADDGRIYVMLSDGREYPCEGVARRGDAALLRITADGLAAAETGEEELIAGERVLAVRCGADVLEGRALGAGVPIRLDISYSDELRGAPIFGQNGRLVGIITHNNGEVCAISIIDIVKFWADLRK